MRREYTRRALGCFSLMMVTLLIASGCVTNSEVGLPPGWHQVDVEKNLHAASLVPQRIRDRGVLRVGTNPPFAPHEFKSDDGTIIGSDIDLITAAAQVLGVRVEVRQAEFDGIIPAVTAGTLDIGATGSSDTEERREKVDFVDYLSSGVQWVTRSADPIDPADPCGEIVAVQRNTVSDTGDIPSQNRRCKAMGKKNLSVLRFDTQDDTALAVILGRAVAFSSDAPVANYTVNRAKGKLTLVGSVRGSELYGWSVQKGSSLTLALYRALQILIDTKKYDEILSQWGLNASGVTEARINGQRVIREGQS